MNHGEKSGTQLVQTPAGYVAASQLIACLQMLTVDACVSPAGDLIIACHSGPPDWGTGPNGIGKLYRVRRQRDLPCPVAVWAESPQEIRITFDRELDPLSARGLREGIRVQYGEHVRAGDRFENMRPPYAVVNAQLMRPRFELPVTGASLTADLRTLIIQTAPMTGAVHYAVTFPWLAERHNSDDADFDAAMRPGIRSLRSMWTSV